MSQHISKGFRPATLPKGVRVLKDGPAKSLRSSFADSVRIVVKGENTEFLANVRDLYRNKKDINR